MAPATLEDGVRTRRRRWRVTVAGIAAVVLAVIFHAPMLRSAAGLLIVDDSLPRTPGYVIINGGDRRYDAAADLYRRGIAKGVLLVEAYPHRLVREGIVPSGEEQTRQVLANRGLPPDFLTVVRGNARNDWQAATLLSDWLNERPDARLIVLCDRFDSRRQRRVLGSALGRQRMQMVSIRALSDRRFDERNWWWSREAWKWVFTCAVCTTYDYCCGEPEWTSPEWEPEEYERAISLSPVASVKQ